LESFAEMADIITVLDDNPSKM